MTRRQHLIRTKICMSKKWKHATQTALFSLSVRKSALIRFSNRPKSTSHSPFDIFASEMRKKQRGLILSSEDWLESWKLRGLASAQKQSFFFIWNNLWIIRRTVHANKANSGVTLTLNLIIWKHGLKKWQVLHAFWKSLSCAKCRKAWLKKT